MLPQFKSHHALPTLIHTDILGTIQTLSTDTILLNNCRCLIKLNKELRLTPESVKAHLYAHVQTNTHS